MLDPLQSKVAMLRKLRAETVQRMLPKAPEPVMPVPEAPRPPEAGEQQPLTDEELAQLLAE